VTKVLLLAPEKYELSSTRNTASLSHNLQSCRCAGKKYFFRMQVLPN